MDTTQHMTPLHPPIPPSPHPQEMSKQHSTSHMTRKIILSFAMVAASLISIGTGIYLYKIKNSNEASQNSPLQTFTELLRQNGTSQNIMPSTGPATTDSQNNSQTNQQTSRSQQSPQPTTASAGQNTVSQIGWKTFTYSAAKFSFAYPSDMQLTQASQGMGVGTIELRSADNTNQANSPDFQFLVFPKALGSLIGQNFDATYAEADNTTATLKDSQGNAQIFTKLQNRTINGLRAFDFRSTASPPDPNTEAEIGTYIEIGGSVVIISTGESEKAMLEQILASFKYPI